MPFQKGNQLAKKGSGRIGVRKKMFTEVSEQLIALSPQYNELLSIQMEGMEIKKSQKEAMDRFERMFEFARPKLSRAETKVDQNVTFTQYDNYKDTELQGEIDRINTSLSREEQAVSE